MGPWRICQKPPFVLIFEKTVAPEIWASVVSTFGSGCTFLKTFWFNGFSSTHMYTPPLGLGITTIASHHGVGIWTFKMTPICSIFLNSTWTLSLSSKGMLLGVYRANGFAPGFSFMVYYPFIVPKPLKGPEIDQEYFSQ